MRQRRLAIYGFENGEFPLTPATDGNITIVAGSARTGNFGVRIAAQSGVNSRFVLPTNMQTPGRLFVRFYLKIDTLPTTRRVLFGQRTDRAVAIGFYGMMIDPDGRLSFADRLTILATSPSALATGRWYRIEWAMDGEYIKLKIDGNVEIDWTDVNWQTDWSTINFGPADTIAATYIAHIDDMAVDNDDFPGHGRVKAIFPSRVAVNTITHTVVGAANALSAIDVSSGWTDSSYIEWSTTGGSFHLGWDESDLPSDARIVYGLRTHWRMQRVSTTSVATMQIGWNGPTHHWNGASNEQFSLQAAITNHIPWTLANQCVFGAFFPEDKLADLTIGFGLPLGTGRCMGAFCEIDYSDEAAAVHPDGVVFLADFEGGVQEMSSATNSQSTGSFGADVTDSVFGSGCMTVTHAAGGRSFMRTSFNLTGTWSKFVGMSVWVKIGALPSSGVMDLFCFIENVDYFSGIQVNNLGQVRIAAHASWGGNGAFISGLTLTTGRWYHFSVELLPPNAASGPLNGYTKLWLDDVFVGQHNHGGFASNFSSTFFVELGSNTVVTGGGSAKYDGLCIDRHVRHTSHLKLATIIPNAPGTSPNAAFTAVGAANKWDCIDDPGINDGDTTYVLCPASGTDLYHATDIPANAVTMMNHIHVIGIGKRDGASNGGTDVAHAITLPHRVTQASAGEMTSGSEFGTTYVGATARLRPAFPTGQLLPSHLPNMQIGFVGALQPVRMTKLYATVAYTAHNPRPPQRGGSSSIVG